LKFNLLKYRDLKLKIILLLFFINLILRFWGIEHSDISHDEPFSIFHSQNDVKEIITNLKSYNNPPLYEIILHFWINVFGISSYSVRALSVLLMSIVAVLIFIFGSKNVNLRVGLTSAFLFTFSSISYYYSHDARAYALFLFLSLLSTYLFFEQLKSYRLKYLILLSLINAALLYTHYFGFIFIGIQIGLMLCFNYRAYFVISYIATLLLYIPQFTVMYERLVDSAKRGTWLEKPEGIESIYNMIWSYTNAPVVAVISIVLIVIFMIQIKNLVIIYSENKLFLIYTIVVFAIAFIGMFFLSYKLPMYLDRYLIFALPFLYYILSITVDSFFFKKTIKYLSSLILVTLFLVTVNIFSDKKRDITAVVNHIKSLKTPEILLIICPKDFAPTFAYHYNLRDFKNSKGIDPLSRLCKNFSNQNIVFVNHYSEISHIEENKFNKVLYLDAEANFAMPENKVSDYLLSQKRILNQKKFQQSFVVSQFE
jgi:mannosyltransferase